MNTNPYCDLEDTNTEFNGNKVYRCKYCNLTLALENADTKMLCFKKMIDTQNLIKQSMGAADGNVVFTSPEKMKDTVLEQVLTEQKKVSEVSSETNMCSKEQIDHRLQICNSCEHYKENLCELCGCTIVREQNYQNKLSHKNASCPINKWGPVT